jgi:hypothetical protein
MREDLTEKSSPILRFQQFILQKARQNDKRAIRATRSGYGSFVRGAARAPHPGLEVPDPSLEVPNPGLEVPDPSLEVPNPGLEVPDPVSAG